MKTKLPRLFWIFSILLSFVLLLGACSANKIPEAAQVALDERITKLDALSLGYAIQSVNKAVGNVDDITIDDLSKQENFVSGCPVDLGGEEAWCVTLDRVLTSPEGVQFSHLIVQRFGQFWNAEALTPSEAYATFYLVGCKDWATIQPVASNP